MSISISRKAGVYLLRSEQYIPANIDSTWQFFSNPKNLQEITPKDLDFHIISTPSETMQEGDIISYRIGIFPLIKTSWVTEIKAVVQQQSFIDEQRFGPYAFWHHRHTFIPCEGGVTMIDEVHFRPPFWIISRITVNLFIAPKLRKIFSYRSTKIEEVFGVE